MFSRLGQGFTGEAMKQVEKLEAENKILKHEVQRLQEFGNRFIDERDSARKELKDSRECQQKTEAALSEQKAEVAKLTDKLREQTESDILLNALKAVGIIKEDKPEKPDYLAENIRLQQQLSGLGHIHDHRPQYSGGIFTSGGAFGGLR